MSETNYDPVRTTFCDAPDCTERIQKFGDEAAHVSVADEDQGSILGQKYCTRTCAIRGLAERADRISHVAIHREGSDAA